MSEAQAPNAERIEKILSTSDFFQATSTRRMLVQRILATGRGVAVGGAVGAAVLSSGMKSVRAANDPVMDFGNAAVGAERIGIAFYSNALGQESPSASLATWPRARCSTVRTAITSWQPATRKIRIALCCRVWGWIFRSASSGSLPEHSTAPP